MRGLLICALTFGGCASNVTANGAPEDRDALDDQAAADSANSEGSAILNCTDIIPGVVGGTARCYAQITRANAGDQTWTFSTPGVYNIRISATPVAPTVNTERNLVFSLQPAVGRQEAGASPFSTIVPRGTHTIQAHFPTARATTVGGKYLLSLRIAQAN